MANFMATINKILQFTTLATISSFQLIWRNFAFFRGHEINFLRTGLSEIFHCSFLWVSVSVIFLNQHRTPKIVFTSNILITFFRACLFFSLFSEIFDNRPNNPPTNKREEQRLESYFVKPAFILKHEKLCWITMNS